VLGLAASQDSPVTADLSSST